MATRSFGPVPERLAITTDIPKARMMHPATMHTMRSQSGEPFVTVGSTVEQGQVMGAIEAMKMMNDVVAGCSGTVSEVLVKDGELVEYAQPLFVIEG